MRGTLSPIFQAVDQSEHLPSRIDARSNIAITSETMLIVETEKEEGTAAQLFTVCLEVLRDLYKIIADSPFNKACTCYATVSRPALGLPLLDDSKEHRSTQGDFCSSPQLHNSICGPEGNNENATHAVEKPDACQDCRCKVASTDLVKHASGYMGKAPRVHNVRAHGRDDEISDASPIHRDPLESSQKDHTSSTIAMLKYLGQRTMKDALGKLFLWGESTMDGGLDRALDESDELRDHVLESLGSIAKILRSSKYQPYF